MKGDRETAVATCMSISPPELATIVIGYRAPADLIGAVRSLLDQSEPTEILVVNSGGGDIATLLGRAGISVPTLEYGERLRVGAARNAGIGATRAPYVAFLASDCRARPGWVAARLARHRSGDRAVASAVVNSRPDSLIATAAHISLFMRRLPGLPADLALRFGASFDRHLFDEYGLFDETLETNEDTEFMRRLPDALRPCWEPAVQTEHRNETRFFAHLADQFRRGRRNGADTARVTGRPQWKIARDLLRQAKPARRLVAIGLAGDERQRAVAAIPVLRLALLAQAFGVIAGPPPPVLAP
jgi:glycosyltransferase involved in cell wall biosynthesis